MKKSDALDPLPEDVRRLLDTERPLPPAPPGLSEEVLSRLRQSAAAGAAAPGAAFPSKLLSAGVGALVAIGAAVFLSLRKPAPASPPSAAHPVPSSVRPPGQRSDDLAQERALLEHARAMLISGRYGPAESALTEHEQTFPAGQLTEEREALRIQLLSADGRSDEARERAMRFRARWPDSIFLDAVDAIAPLQKK